MSEDARFEGLKKLPDRPAAEVLKDAKLELEVELQSPPEAPVRDVLMELHRRELYPEAVQLLSQSLPRREAVWWTCLAAREMVGFDTPREEVPRCLAAAEAWVFRPGDETREGAFAAMQEALPSDDTALCATAAVYAKGTFGPDDLDEAELAPGVFGHIVFGMVMTAWGEAPDEDIEARAVRLIDRALDIARGGNGRLEEAAGAAEAAPGA
jgi:hypothetical protein